MIAKRAFPDQVVLRVNIAFNNKISIGGTSTSGWVMQRTSSTFFFRKKTGQHVFIHIFRQRRRCRIGIHRVAAKRHGYRHPFSQLFIFVKMLCRHFVLVPVHACKRRAKHLHAVHAHISGAGIRVFGMNDRKGNKRAAVFWPAGNNRKLCNIRDCL
jgi:hypothetical protein